MNKIITFDIWDTILKRKCHPEEIKLATSRYIMLKYEEKLKEEYKDIYKILVTRDDIEYKECMRHKEEGFDDECRILDVFKILQKEIMKQDIGDISEELLREEIEQEKKAIFISPEILPIFEKYKDLEKYCISDFYMGADALQELFDHVQVPVKINKIYSSADYLKNKRTGNLYKIAQEEIGLKSENHIHVGDNVFADIDNAKKLGIETVKTTKTEFAFEHNKDRKFNFDLSELYKDGDTQENRLYNSGIDLAPILYFYGYSIIEYAIKNKMEKIYYATREGETFIKIHEIIESNNPFGVELPKKDIIEVSRMATFAPSLKEISIPELLRLWSQYRSQTLKALFKTLNVDIKKYENLLEKYELEAKEEIIEPWFNTKLQKLFADEEFSKMMNEELKKKKENLLKYFEETKGIKNDEKPMLMVDIGWRGTIQDNLAYIFDKKDIYGYYLTLYDFYNTQPKNTKKVSYISDENIKKNEVASMITLLEWIFNPGTGSVVEYKNGKAIRKAKEEEIEVVNTYIKVLQEGMLEGAKLINEYMKYHPYEAEETKKKVYEVLTKTKQKPSKELIEAYYKMVFNDTFGADEYVEKEQKLSGIKKYNVFKVRKKLRAELWKEAYVIHHDLKYMDTLVKLKGKLRK